MRGIAMGPGEAAPEAEAGTLLFVGGSQQRGIEVRAPQRESNEVDQVAERARGRSRSRSLGG
jgi:hypothetical protein